MADPKLVRTSVQISYAATDGYRSQCGYVGDKGNGPNAGLLGGLDEIARLLALFGHEDDARLAFENAINRATEWRAARIQAPAEAGGNG